MARGQNEPLMVSIAGDERLASVGPKGVKMMKRYYNSKTEGVSVISDYQHTELTKQQVLDAISAMDTGTTRLLIQFVYCPTLYCVANGINSKQQQQQICL